MDGAVAAVAEPDAAEEEEALPVRQVRAPPHLLRLGTPCLVQPLVRGSPTPAAVACAGAPRCPRRRGRRRAPLRRRAWRRGGWRGWTYRKVRMLGLAAVGLAPVEEVLEEPAPAA